MAPHTRREQANMRAALTVAREQLRCRLMESGRDALLERVTELLDAAATGAPPFCYQLTPQAAAGSHCRTGRCRRSGLRYGSYPVSRRRLPALWILCNRPLCQVL